MSHAEAQQSYIEACAKLAGRDVSPALRLFGRAESLGWSADECAAGRWDCFMLLGDFECAWRESDSIASRGAPDPHRLWDGLTFTGRHVMLRCLHGLGDTIQFIRYSPLIRAEARRLVVEVPARMMSLVARVDGVDEVISWEVPRSHEPHWDQHIEIMEVPRAFRTTCDSIPNRRPYLDVSRTTSDSARNRWKIQGGSKVGLVWASSAWDHSRSLPMEKLVPVLRKPGFSFFSLQAGPEQSQLVHLPPGCNCRDLVDDSITPLETAAQISNLDLVITVDTMVAHLAGALGKPVWLMLNFASDWRWMLHRADSAWYPSMTIFRQPRQGDWDSVMRQIDAALDEFPSRRREMDSVTLEA